jgi:hypothetical protein
MIQRRCLWCNRVLPQIMRAHAQYCRGSRCRTAATRDRQKEAFAAGADGAQAELPPGEPAPGLVQLHVKSGGAPLLLAQRSPPPKTPPGREEVLAHWNRERIRHHLPNLRHNLWCESRAEILAYECAIQYFDQRLRHATASQARDHDAEWACVHFQDQLQSARRRHRWRQPPPDAQIEEQKVLRLAEWPGPPWLVRYLGLQLLPPQVGIEAIVVMSI